MCCSPQGCKESDTTEWLNWTELKAVKMTMVRLPVTNFKMSELTAISAIYVAPPSVYKMSCPWLSKVRNWPLDGIHSSPAPVVCIQKKINFSFYQPSLFNGFGAVSDKTPTATRSPLSVTFLGKYSNCSPTFFRGRSDIYSNLQNKMNHSLRNRFFKEQKLEKTRQSPGLQDPTSPS